MLLNEGSGMERKEEERREGTAKNDRRAGEETGKGKGTGKGNSRAS